jgi:hypothetical protein
MFKYLMTFLMGATMAAHAVSFDLEDFALGASGWSGVGSFAVTASEDGNPTNSLQGTLSGVFREAGFVADSDASNGSFTGDYTSLGVTTLTFDFYAATIAPTALFVALYNGADNIEFVRYLTTPTVLTWSSYAVALAYPFGWLGGTSGEFSTMMADISEVTIGIIGTDGGGSEVYRLDNVQLTNDVLPPAPVMTAVPEPGTGGLVLLGITAFMLHRRRLMRKE